MPDVTTTPAVWIRWAIKKDLPAMVECVADTARPWDEAEFRARLRHRNVIGMVAESRHDGRILGTVVYELLPSRVRILNLAAHPDARGRGVGRAMLAKMVRKGSEYGRRGVVAVVPEGETGVLCWLRGAGFGAVRVLDGAVVMEWLAEPN